MGISENKTTEVRIYENIDSLFFTFSTTLFEFNYTASWVTGEQRKYLTEINISYPLHSKKIHRANLFGWVVLGSAPTTAIPIWMPGRRPLLLNRGTINNIHFSTNHPSYSPKLQKNCEYEDSVGYPSTVLLKYEIDGILEIHHPD